MKTVSSDDPKKPSSRKAIFVPSRLNSNACPNWVEDDSTFVPRSAPGPFGCPVWTSIVT